MILIGIHGKKKAGKDTLYNYIKACVPLMRVERIGFADSLKAEVAKAFGVTVEFLEAHKDKFRHILQAWGDGRREITSKTYWIEKVTRKLNESIADMVVIPDVRYKNEFDFIRTLGGYLIRIKKPVPLLADFRLDTHPSEIELDHTSGFDFCVTNDREKEYLHTAAKHILKTLKQIE